MYMCVYIYYWQSVYPAWFFVFEPCCYVVYAVTSSESVKIDDIILFDEVAILDTVLHDALALSKLLVRR